MNPRRVLLTLPQLERFRRISNFFPWTRLGLLILGISFVVLNLFAYARLDLVLLVVGYMSLGLPIVTAIMVSGASLWLRRQLKNISQNEKLRVETSFPISTGYSIPSLRFLPLIQVHWTWENPKASDVTKTPKTGRQYEMVRMDHRGQFRGITRRFIVEDVLGLSRVAFQTHDAMELDVLPHLGNLKRIPSLLSMAGGDELPHPMGVEGGDRLELQRYIPGDPARFIHWKVFGRTRKLMIRVQERALSTSRRTCAFILAGAEDEATSAVARIAIEEQLLGTDWLFGSDEDILGTSDREEALDILMRSTNGRDKSGTGLGVFIEQAQKKGEASILVFVPPAKGRWMSFLKDVAQAHKVHVVIGTDWNTAIQPKNWWSRWVLLPHPNENASTEELQSVVQALNQNNFQVTVFDRNSGRSLAAHDLQSAAG